MPQILKNDCFKNMSVALLLMGYCIFLKIACFNKRAAHMP